MLKNTTTALSLVILTAWCNAVLGFTTAAPSTLSTIRGGNSNYLSFNPINLRPSQTRVNIASSSSSSFGGGKSPAELQKLEKQEAAIIKQRQQAAERLDAYDKSLKELQTKKAEYLAASQIAKPPVGGTFSETTARSAVKALLWRVIAGSITFATTLRFSGSVSSALKVVGADFFSKALTMFIGERLMNKSQAGRQAGADNIGRSVAKALIWRLFAIANTLTVAVFVSKDLSVASKIASTDAVFKTALMFAYERVWARVEWGKEYKIEYSI